MSNDSKKSTARIWLGGIVVVAISIAGLVLLTLNQQHALAREGSRKIAEINEGPVVKVVKAGAMPSDKGLVLIGETRPYETVTLYAKTSGYMNRILVDKGDKVRNGQLLATIVSPETDQAYRAAVADLANKKKIAARDAALVQKEYISKEDAETSATAVEMAEAQVKSLKEQMDYKNIVAPFAGTVTARFADPGALVQNATGSQTSAQPVVTVSQVDKIRIYVYVAQDDANNLKNGDPVILTMADRPELKINAEVNRIAGEMDPKTRMMLAEVDLDNSKYNIIPGSYLQVTFATPTDTSLSLPSEAIVIRAGKYYVPVISNGTLSYRPVTLGNNNGIRVAVRSGINAGELVAINVSPELAEGQKVRVQL